MAERSIDITVTVKGDVEIEANGYTGKACLSATSPYEKAAGLEDIVRETKPEIREIAGEKSRTNNTLKTSL